ncbi:MAG: 1,4-alpha-glucan branching protein GlgB, partial [Planctomycetota bacterium]
MALYDHLGAHPEDRDGSSGTRFAVWAPNAESVSVICDGNGWTPGADDLWGSSSGVWEGFVPGFGRGDRYKYAIRTRSGELLEKSDPFAFHAEHPPQTASVCWDLSRHRWEDAAWIDHRRDTDWLRAPISVYEVHLGSWKRPTDGRRYFSYHELAEQLCDHCEQYGFTHLELMPIAEYPFDGSWGYQATGYFAPTSRFGTPDDFMRFVDTCHQRSIGVMIDWVPAHFPTDAHSLARFDGTCLYEHADPRQGYHPDWNTLIFNYGRDEVRRFLTASARFWIEKYHIDGLRVDAVASMLYLDYSRKSGEWVPNKYGGRENLEAIDFLKELNVELHRDFPGVLTIAEESTSWGGVSHPTYNGGLGFSFKWDMGWMNDTLRYIEREPLYRSYHHNELTFRSVYQFSENYMLPLSHDEVVHGKSALLDKMPGDIWQKFANLRLLYAYQWLVPGKKLLFMGCELAQWDEWNHDGTLDWALEGQPYHDGIRRFLGDLNHLYKSRLALHGTDCDPAGYQWVSGDDANRSILSFVRRTADGSHHLLC